jgi:hypothetical protein
MLLPACSEDTHDLYDSEYLYLTEDIDDLLTIAFQAGENAFVGDSVEPGDIVEPAGPGNDFTATYDLPLDDRIGLGLGAGRVALRVVEDGVVSPAPLSFSFGTTSADHVVLVYELRYDGETSHLRTTVVDLTITLDAVRGPGGEFDVTYHERGDVLLGNTRCIDVALDFVAPGRPRDGIVGGVGDGFAWIDDPGVYDLMELDLDWGEGEFIASGDVGCCAFYERLFDYREVT